MSIQNIKRGLRAKLNLYEDDCYRISPKMAEDIAQSFQSWGFISPEYQTEIESTILEYLRPKMEWKPQFSNEYGYVIYYCSNCGNDEMYQTPFCPICGAMREDKC